MTKLAIILNDLNAGPTKIGTITQKTGLKTSEVKQMLKSNGYKFSVGKGMIFLKIKD